VHAIFRNQEPDWQENDVNIRYLIYVADNIRSHTISMNDSTFTTEQRERASHIAHVMFWLSTLFLGLLAAIIVTWIDIPGVVELATTEAAETGSSSQSLIDALALAERAEKIGSHLLYLLFALWPLFWIEYFYSLTRTKQASIFSAGGIQRLMACVVPPLRLGTTSTVWGNRLWLPSLSWQHPSRELSVLLGRIFSRPMLIIALLILPILLIEFVFKNTVNDHFWLRMLLHWCTGFIWFAFAFEFIILVSATDKKLAYIKKNWIDLAIILLPIISFLRSLRALRLARLAKVQKLVKLGRVYRMRGLGMKVLRALLLLEVVNRILRITPEKRLAKLQAVHNEKSEELAELQLEIDTLKEKIAVQNQDS
jgi:voltage-gated potassium channel